MLGNWGDVSDVMLTEGMLAFDVDEAELATAEGIARVWHQVSEGSHPGILGRLRYGSFSAMPEMGDVGGKDSLLNGRRVHPIRSWQSTLKGEMEKFSRDALHRLVPGCSMAEENGVRIIGADMGAELPQNAVWAGTTAIGRVLIYLREPVSTGGCTIDMESGVGRIDVELKAWCDGDNVPFRIYLMEGGGDR